MSAEFSEGNCTLYVFCDGVWETVDATSGSPEPKQKHVKLKNNVTFTKLIDKAYHVTQWNREDWNIEMTWWAKYGSKSFAVPVTDDEDVESLVRLNTKDICSTPLCLVSKKKQSAERAALLPATVSAELPVVEPANQPVSRLAKLPALSSTKVSSVWSSEQPARSPAEPSAEQPAELAVVGSAVWPYILSPVNHEPGEDEQSYLEDVVAPENLSRPSASTTRKRKVSTTSSDACTSIRSDIKLKHVFNSRAALLRHLRIKAALKNREFRTKKCDSRRFVVCFVENCPWRLRASSVSKGGVWIVKRYHNVHTCSVDRSSYINRNVSCDLVADMVKDRYSNPTHVFPPAAIICAVKNALHVDIKYQAAWRARERAIGIVMGTPVESFAKLPAYFHRLKEVNPGTITHIERHEDGHFKYCFMSLGASQRGFRGNIRPIVAVDGTFLRGKYGRTLLLATSMDGQKQIYPIAFGVVDSENNASWNWFLVKLHEIIGDLPDLVIVSDRNKSIMKGVTDVFPDAVHGICMFHLKMNATAKFKNLDFAGL